VTSLYQAHLVVTVVGLLPVAAAYIEAKHYFRFKQRSLQQFLAVGLTLLVLLGAIPLQSWVLDWCGFSTSDEYLRRLTFFQYLIALIVFSWRLWRTNQMRIAESTAQSPVVGPTS
jgi:glucan phosphoethanolaminetransferase (alkaline phosphatase superfamily)